MDILYYITIAALTLAFASMLVYTSISHSYSFKTVTVHNDKNIEARLRILMWKNPKCEIVIINRSGLPEISHILGKMQCDFPCLHIIEL